MKKIFFSILAVAAVAACTKTEPTYQPEAADIMLNPTTALSTKANVNGVIDGTVYPTSENFDVYAYWSDGWKGEPTKYFITPDNSGAEFKYSGGSWKGATTAYHWPKDGSVKFAAYSPASVNLKHTYATDTYYTTGYTQPSATDATYDLLLAKTTADYTAETAANGVPVVFEHALSWITINVISDVTTSKAFTIKEMTINGVNTKADLKAAMADGVQYNEWSNQSTPAGYKVFSGSQTVTNTLAKIENNNGGTIVIPQVPTTLTIKFDQNQLAGTAALPNQQIDLSLALARDNKWAPGRHYTYTIIFSLDEILINPSVNDWADSYDYDIL